MLLDVLIAPHLAIDDETKFGKRMDDEDAVRGNDFDSTKQISQLLQQFLIGRLVGEDASATFTSRQNSSSILPAIQ